MHFKIFTGKEYVRMMVFAAIFAGILWGLELLAWWIFGWSF